MGRKSYYLKLVLAIIALLTALPLSLNLYIEFTTPCPYDVGRNVYSVKHILAGAKIGVDEESRMLVGELMLHTLGVLLYSKGDIGPKIVQAILQITSLLCMFVALRKLYGLLPAAVSVIVASLYLSSPIVNI